MPKHPITDARADGLMIGELSRQTGVNIETIRYYERIKMLPAPPRTTGGRRIYGPLETRTLLFIRRARELGFSLDQIRALLALGGPGKATCSEVCAIATRHLDEICSKIADLQKLKRLLSRTVAQCSSDAVPDCAVLDVLYPPAVKTNTTMRGKVNASR
ncbi:MAG: HTH-type transcriptional regulator HmrR [Pseudorhodoplanes sp.]|nr:HTH-type transcriptional regulator HmrR [Pseudorhodoplanes sp.]